MGRFRRHADPTQANSDRIGIPEAAQHGRTVANSCGRQRLWYRLQAGTIIVNVDAPASPACLPHEAEDGYMGFASRDEIVRVLTDLETAPAAAKAEMIRRMLPKIGDDALHAELRARLASIGASSAQSGA